MRYMCNICKCKNKISKVYETDSIVINSYDCEPNCYIFRCFKL